MHMMTFDRTVNLVQLASIVGGIAYFGIEAGRRDERLAVTTEKVSELASIVQDLAKAQIASATNVSNAQRDLDNLRSRIERLEGSSR